MPITLTCNFGGIRRRALEDFEDKKRKKKKRKKKRFFATETEQNKQTNKQLDLVDRPCQLFRKRKRRKELDDRRPGF